MSIDADDPRVLQFIQVADDFYVFPVATPLHPRRDNKRLRQLDDRARRLLVDLFRNQRNWWHGAYTLVTPQPEPRNIGLLFRHDRSELVLFFSASSTSSAGLIKGAFNGYKISGMLEDAPGKKMEQWARRYAQPELAAK